MGLCVTQLSWVREGGRGRETWILCDAAVMGERGDGIGRRGFCVKQLLRETGGKGWGELNAA